jgi:hypothetical protein
MSTSEEPTEAQIADAAARMYSNGENYSQCIEQSPEIVTRKVIYFSGQTEIMTLPRGAFYFYERTGIYNSTVEVPEETN